MNQKSPNFFHGQQFCLQSQDERPLSISIVFAVDSSYSPNFFGSRSCDKCESNFAFEKKIAKLVNLTPITDHVNFTMSLQCGWSILLKARSNSVISRVIQLSNSFPERTIHEDKRIRKSWELQFRQNKSLERIEINGKLRIGHKSMSRSRNKSRG